MAKKLYGSLVNMFGRKKLSEQDMITWAKVEYANDWVFAYNHIKLFRFGWEKHDPIETYLANSTDLADLENRQKQLVYGTVNPNLKGWI